MKTRVGVEMSRSKINIFCLSPSGKSLQRNLIVPENYSHSEFLSFVKTSINNFIKDNNLKSGSINITLSPDQKDIVVKLLKLPMLNKSALGKAIKYEIEDSGMVNNLDMYHHKWAQVGEDTDDGKIIHLVGAVRKDILSELSSLKKIRWSVEAINLKPLVIGRYVKETSVVIDCDYENTTVYFYRDGIINDISQIPTGTKRVDEIFQEVMPNSTNDEIEKVLSQTFFFGLNEDVSFKETFQEKKSVEILDIRDLSAFKQEVDKDILMEISFKISQDINYISSEVKRLVRQFELSHNLSIKNFYYLGDASKIHPLVDRLEKTLEIESIALSSIIHEKEIPFEDEVYLMANASVLSKEKKSQLDFSKLLKNNTDLESILIAVAISSLLLNAGVFVSHEKYTEQLNEARSVESSQEKTKREIEMEISNLTKEERNNNRIHTMLSELASERIFMSEFLKRLPDITPDAVAVQKLTLENESILIQGFSKNYTNLGLFLIELEDIGEVTVDYIDREKDGVNKIITGEEPHQMNNEFTIRLKTKFPLR